MIIDKRDVLAGLAGAALTGVVLDAQADARRAPAMPIALPIALRECGPIPDPDLVAADGAKWLYFLVWHSDFIHDGVTNPVDFLS